LALVAGAACCAAREVTGATAENHTTATKPNCLMGKRFIIL
jgi:hypothetical protein